MNSVIRNGVKQTDDRIHKELDYRAIIWERKFLILSCMTVGAVLGYWQFQKSPPVYLTHASIYVENQNVRSKIDDSEKTRPLVDPLDDHVVLIKTPAVLKPAVEDYHLSDLPSLAGKSDPVAAVADGLSIVRPIDSPSILRLTYKCGHQSDAKTILNAVVASYLNYLGESQKNSSDRVLELISKAKTELSDELKRKEEEYQRFREQTGFIRIDESGQNLHQVRLAQIESQRSALMIESSQTRAELDALESARVKGADHESLLMIVDQSLKEKNGVLNNSESITGRLIPLLLEESLLLESVGPEHPKVREVRKKIEVTRLLLNKADGEFRADASSNTSREGLLMVYLQSLKERLNVLNQKIAELDQLFAEEKASASQLSADENQDRVLHDEIKRVNGLFHVVVETLQKASLVKDNYSLIGRVVQEPVSAYPVQSRLFVFLGIGGGLAGLAGFLFALLLESGDKRFRSPEEISDIVHAPVLAHIPLFHKATMLAQNSPVSKDVITLHHPKSSISEAYRMIRTSVLLDQKNSGSRIIQLTSPDPSDGKSTACANLGVSIAASGRRCLIVDLDLRRPSQARLFSLDENLGLSSILVEGGELNDAIQSTSIAMLDVLTSGPLVDTPGELLQHRQLPELFESLREKYDILLVDSPPLLAVSDSNIISNIVDSTHLVMTNTRHAIKKKKKTMDYLSLVSTELMGVIVNKWSASDGYRYVYGEYDRGIYSDNAYTYDQKKYTSGHSNDSLLSLKERTSA